jgi:hypothetical protein
MTKTYAKSNAVEGKNESTLMAKSKDYSIYSQTYTGSSKHLINRGQGAGAPKGSAKYKQEEVSHVTICTKTAMSRGGNEAK